jgi:predicted nucleotidyltransferase component of viral defense system
MALDKTVHKNILIKILKNIYGDSSLGPILGFKGGTAAYLFYNLERFSVDLDFDLLDKEKEDYVFEQIKKILENYGTLKQAEKKKFNLIYVLSYSGKARGGQNIKVEINRREFGSKYEVRAYFGISMRVMIQEDMFAHKLCAMYERIGKTNRDIFDVWYFLQNEWPVNRKIVEDRTGIGFKEFLQKCIDLMEKISSQNIFSGMGELLDNKQKDWVRAKLKSETIFLLKLRLDSEE